MTKFFFSHCETTVEANTREEAEEKLISLSKKELPEVESEVSSETPQSPTKKKAKWNSSKK